MRSRNHSNVRVRASISRRFHCRPTAATARTWLVRAPAYIAYILTAAVRRLAGKKRKRRIDRGREAGGGRQSPKEAWPFIETVIS